MFIFCVSKRSHQVSELIFVGVKPFLGGVIRHAKLCEDIIGSMRPKVNVAKLI